MKGYVYILSNPSMPGLIKVGMTTRSVEGRALELYQTGVPTPFVVEHSVASPDCAALERDIHNALGDCRVGEGREFFRRDVSCARDLLEEALIEQLRGLVWEFTESFVLCEAPLFVDPGVLSLLCSSTRDVHPFEFADAIDLLDPAAVQAAVDASRARNARRRAPEATACVVLLQ